MSLAHEKLNPLAVLDAVITDMRASGDTGHVENLLQARADVAELMDQHDELSARLKQILPYLYLIKNEGPKTAVPVAMKIQQVESALSRVGSES
jgi:hypothetical protein